MDDFLSRIFGHIGALAAVATTFFLLAAEIGYWRGLRLYAAGDSARRHQIGAVQAAMLGLLALLLGFTFSMAIEPYDHVWGRWRRGAIALDERAAFPACHRGDAVDLRSEQRTSGSHQRQPAAVDRSSALNSIADR